MNETTFREQLARDGYTEVLVRDWAPDLQLAEHSHPFDARLMLLAGALQLTRASGVMQFQPGDCCDVPCGELHAERYGPQGAQVLVGRRHPPAA